MLNKMVPKIESKRSAEMSIHQWKDSIEQLILIHS